MPPPAAATVVVNLDLSSIPSQFQRAIAQAQASAPPINLKVGPNGLGKISSDVKEFTKSLEAANARVISFTATTGVIYGLGAAFTGLVRSTIDVEKRLSAIQILVKASASDFNKLKSSLFDIAGATGASFDEAATAAQEFARQGLSVNQTLIRTKDALILARQSGLDYAESVKDITSAINTFSREALSSTDIVNKLESLNGKFAVSSRDLAEAISRTGAVAKDAGLNFDQLLAVITSVQQQTQRGGAVIGNAFQSIFTRTARPETLQALTDLGVQTRKLSGDTLPLINVLQNLAQKYSSLSDNQKESIASQIAGTRQINIAKVLLTDLARANSAYSNSIQTSSKSTDEAIRKNEELNQTLSAQLNRAKESGAALANAFGSRAIEPALKSLTGNVNSLFDKIKEIGGAQTGTAGVGSTIGKGIVDGIGSALKGPGTVLFGTIFLSIFTKVATFAKNSLSELAGLNKSTRDQETVQNNINRVLSEGNSYYKQRITAAKTLQEEEEVILQLMRQENALLQLRQSQGSAVASSLINRGQGLFSNATFGSRNEQGFNRVPRAANGLISSINDESNAVKAGVGGASSTARPVVIPNFNFGGNNGPIVANSDEYVVKNYAGGRGSAIFNQNMVRGIGGVGNLSNFGSVQKVGAKGFIPNYAENFIGLNKLDPKLNYLLDTSDSEFLSGSSLVENQIQRKKLARNQGFELLSHDDFLDFSKNTLAKKIGRRNKFNIYDPSNSIPEFGGDFSKIFNIKSVSPLNIDKLQETQLSKGLGKSINIQNILSSIGQRVIHAGNVGKFTSATRNSLGSEGFYVKDKYGLQGQNVFNANELTRNSKKIGENFFAQSVIPGGDREFRTHVLGIGGKGRIVSDTLPRLDRNLGKVIDDFASEGNSPGVGQGSLLKTLFSGGFGAAKNLLGDKLSARIAEQQSLRTFNSLPKELKQGTLIAPDVRETGTKSILGKSFQLLAGKLGLNIGSGGVIELNPSTDSNFIGGHSVSGGLDRPDTLFSIAKAMQGNFAEGGIPISIAKKIFGQLKQDGLTFSRNNLNYTALQQGGNANIVKGTPLAEVFHELGHYVNIRRGEDDFYGDTPLLKSEAGASRTALDLIKQFKGSNSAISGTRNTLLPFLKGYKLDEIRKSAGLSGDVLSSLQRGNLGSGYKNDVVEGGQNLFSELKNKGINLKDLLKSNPELASGLRQRFATGFVPNYAPFNIDKSQVGGLLGSGAFRNVFSFGQDKILSYPKTIEGIVKTYESFTGQKMTKDEIESLLEAKNLENSLRPIRQQQLGFSGVGPSVHKIFDNGAFTADRINDPTLSKLLKSNQISKSLSDKVIAQATKKLSSLGFDHADLHGGNIAYNLKNKNYKVLDLANGLVPNFALDPAIYPDKDLSLKVRQNKINVANSNSQGSPGGLYRPTSRTIEVLANQPRNILVHELAHDLDRGGVISGSKKFQSALAKQFRTYPATINHLYPSESYNTGAVYEESFAKLVQDQLGGGGVIKSIVPELAKFIPDSKEFHEKYGNTIKEFYKRKQKLGYNYANGFIPNFSNPLNDAISRESKHVGLNNVYVDRDERLKSSSNPLGLLVANKRDEPNGGFQGVNRAFREGLNPKKYGSGNYANGFIPNFAPLSTDLQDLVDSAAPRGVAPNLGNLARSATQGRSFPTFTTALQRLVDNAIDSINPRNIVSNQGQERFNRELTQAISGQLIPGINLDDLTRSTGGLRIQRLIQDTGQRALNVRSGEFSSINQQQNISQNAQQELRTLQLQREAATGQSILSRAQAGVEYPSDTARFQALTRRDYERRIGVNNSVDRRNFIGGSQEQSDLYDRVVGIGVRNASNQLSNTRNSSRLQTFIGDHYFEQSQRSPLNFVGSFLAQRGFNKAIETDPEHQAAIEENPEFNKVLRDNERERLGSRSRFLQHAGFQLSFAAPILAQTGLSLAGVSGDSRTGRVIGGATEGLATAGLIGSLGVPPQISAILGAFLGLKSIVDNVTKSVEDLNKEISEQVNKKEDETRAIGSVIQSYSNLIDSSREGPIARARGVSQFNASISALPNSTQGQITNLFQNTPINQRQDKLQDLFLNSSLRDSQFQKAGQAQIDITKQLDISDPNARQLIAADNLRNSSNRFKRFAGNATLGYIGAKNLINPSTFDSSKTFNPFDGTNAQGQSVSEVLSQSRNKNLNSNQIGKVADSFASIPLPGLSNVNFGNFNLEKVQQDPKKALQDFYKEAGLSGDGLTQINKTIDEFFSVVGDKDKRIVTVLRTLKREVDNAKNAKSVENLAKVTDDINKFIQFSDDVLKDVSHNFSISSFRQSTQRQTGLTRSNQLLDLAQPSIQPTTFENLRNTNSLQGLRSEHIDNINEIVNKGIGGLSLPQDALNDPVLRRQIAESVRNISNNPSSSLGQIQNIGETLKGDTKTEQSGIKLGDEAKNIAREIDTENEKFLASYNKANQEHVFNLEKINKERQANFLGGDFTKLNNFDFSKIDQGLGTLSQSRNNQNLFTNQNSFDNFFHPQRDIRGERQRQATQDTSVVQFGDQLQDLGLLDNNRNARGFFAGKAKQGGIASAQNLISDLVTRANRFGQPGLAQSIYAQRGDIEGAEGEQAARRFKTGGTSLIDQQNAFNDKLISSNTNSLNPIQQNTSAILDNIKSLNNLSSVLDKIAQDEASETKSESDPTQGTVVNQSKGFVPNFNAFSKELRDIRNGIGGSRNGDYPFMTNISGLGNSVVNSGESIIRNFLGSGKDAVFNREMQKSFGGNLNSLGRVENSANGFIPNFFKRSADFDSYENRFLSSLSESEQDKISVKSLIEMQDFEKQLVSNKNSQRHNGAGNFLRTEEQKRERRKKNKPLEQKQRLALSGYGYSSGPSYDDVEDHSVKIKKTKPATPIESRKVQDSLFRTFITGNTPKTFDPNRSLNLALDYVSPENRLDSSIESSVGPINLNSRISEGQAAISNTLSEAQTYRSNTDAQRRGFRDNAQLQAFKSGADLSSYVNTSSPSGYGSSIFDEKNLGPSNIAGYGKTIFDENNSSKGFIPNFSSLDFGAYNQSTSRGPYSRSLIQKFGGITNANSPYASNIQRLIKIAGGSNAFSSELFNRVLRQGESFSPLDEAINRESLAIKQQLGIPYHLAKGYIFTGYDSRIGLGVGNTIDEKSGLINPNMGITEGVNRAIREGHSPKTYGSVPNFAENQSQGSNNEELIAAIKYLTEVFNNKDDKKSSSDSTDINHNVAANVNINLSGQVSGASQDIQGILNDALSNLKQEIESKLQELSQSSGGTYTKSPPSTTPVSPPSPLVS